MTGTDWLWYAAGVATAFLLTAATLRVRRARWIRRHSYVAEVSVSDWRGAVQRNDDLATDGPAAEDDSGHQPESRRASVRAAP